MSTEQLDKVLMLVVGTLGRLLNPSALESAIRAAAQDAGITDIDSYMKAAMPTLSAAKAAKKNKKADGGEKTKKPRAMTPYQVFVAKAMDKVSKEPSYRKLTEGPDGGKVHPMSIAGHLWKGLSDDDREAFVKAYQPLCDQLKVENDISGHKTDGLVQRIGEYENKFSSAVAQVMHVLPSNFVGKPVLPSAGTLAAASDETSSSDEDDDEDEDEDEDATRKAKEEADRIAKEEAEKKAKEERKKKKEDKKGKKADKTETKEAVTPNADENGKKQKRKQKDDEVKSSTKKSKKDV